MGKTHESPLFFCDFDDFLWDFLSLRGLPGWPKSWWDDQVDLFPVLALRQWPLHYVGQPHDVLEASKRTEFGFAVSRLLGGIWINYRWFSWSFWCLNFFFKLDESNILFRIITLMFWCFFSPIISTIIMMNFPDQMRLPRSNVGSSNLTATSLQLPITSMACREHGWIRWISTTYCDQNHVREWPWQLETSSNHQPDSSGHWQGQTCLTFGRTVTKVTKCEKRFWRYPSLLPKYVFGRWLSCRKRPTTVSHLSLPFSSSGAEAMWWPPS